MTPRSTRRATAVAFVLLVIPAFTLPAQARAEPATATVAKKRALTPADYGKWESLGFGTRAFPRLRQPATRPDVTRAALPPCEWPFWHQANPAAK